MWLPIATVVVQYCTTTAKPLLAMALRDGGDDDAAAAVALGLREHWPAPAGFEHLPTAVQKMWVHSNDAVKFREQAGAVIAAYQKALEAGALQSTAERAAAAVASKIDPGYRVYVEHEKNWQLERRAAAAKLEALAMKARRLLKKARKLVTAGTVWEHMPNKGRARDFADVIRCEVQCVREMIVELDMEARMIPCHLDLPFAKEEVYSCICSVDRMQSKADLAYKRARKAWREASV